MRTFVQSLAAKKRFLQRRYFDFCSNLVFYPGSSASDKNTSFYFPIFLSRPRTAFSSWRREAPGLFTVLPSLSRGTHMLRFFSLQIGDLPVCTNKWIMLDSAPFLTLFFFIENIPVELTTRVEY